MRAMASASSGLAALACTAASSPFLTPTLLPQFSLVREVHHHGQSSAAPIVETSRNALVLLDQEPPCKVIFLRAFGLAGPSAETFSRYADHHLGIAPEVLHPVRAVAAPGEHVKGLRLGNKREPDLDLVRPARYPPRRRQVAEVLFGERTEI